MILGQIDYERLIGNLGVPAVFMLGVLYVLAKYAPKVVAAHLDFIEAAKRHGEQCVALQSRHEETLDAILELVAEKMDARGDAKYRDHVFSTVRTNQALVQFADVVEELARGSAQESQVAVHLKAIQETLSERPARRREPAKPAAIGIAGRVVKS